MYLFLAFFFEIFGYARQYEQALLHSLARKLAAPRKGLKYVSSRARYALFPPKKSSTQH